MSNQLLSLADYSTQAEVLVNSIGIPAQPKILMEVNKEINSPDASFSTVADMISKDVSMSAKVLKVVNSAIFGLSEKVDSIDRALAMMGLKNFNKIIIASSLREALGSFSGMEGFWNHSMAVATISSYIADKTSFVSSEQAYTAGLFHDCGIPYLAKKYKDYPDLAEHALSVVHSEALSGATRSVIGVEDERYRTHHCAVGYVVAKSWNLSPEVHKSIWYHHYVHLNIHENDTIKKLSAILILADYIASHLHYISGGTCPVEQEHSWAEAHPEIMSELHFNVVDIKDMREDLEEKIMDMT